MRFVLYILAIISLLFGLMIFMAARGAVHEILGGVAFVCASVLIVGGAVCTHLAAIERATRERPTPPRE